MQVIKRDGKIVDFDKSKIRIAIEKANKEVKPKERASKDEINEIINYIEELDKKKNSCRRYSRHYRRTINGFWKIFISQKVYYLSLY